MKKSRKLWKEDISESLKASQLIKTVTLLPLQRQDLL